MRFITEFEQDGSSFDNSPAVLNLRKEHAEDKLGALISEAFEWEEKGSTSLAPKDPVKHIHKLEIEAFPMDKWVEFKKRFLSALPDHDNTSRIRLENALHDLESFGKPEDIKQ